jgi:hypothetical protein
MTRMASERCRRLSPLPRLVIGYTFVEKRGGRGRTAVLEVARSHQIRDKGKIGEGRHDGGTN